MSVIAQRTVVSRQGWEVPPEALRNSVAHCETALAAHPLVRDISFTKEGSILLFTKEPTPHGCPGWLIRARASRYRTLHAALHFVDARAKAKAEARAVEIPEIDRVIGGAQ